MCGKAIPGLGNTENLLAATGVDEPLVGQGATSRRDTVVAGDLGCLPVSHVSDVVDHARDGTGST